MNTVAQDLTDIVWSAKNSNSICPNFFLKTDGAIVFAQPDNQMIFNNERCYMVSPNYTYTLGNIIGGYSLDLEGFIQIELKGIGETEVSSDFLSCSNQVELKKKIVEAADDSEQFVDLIGVKNCLLLGCSSGIQKMVFSGSKLINLIKDIVINFSEDSEGIDMSQLFTKSDIIYAEFFNFIETYSIPTQTTDNCSDEDSDDSDNNSSIEVPIVSINNEDKSPTSFKIIQANGDVTIYNRNEKKFAVSSNQNTDVFRISSTKIQLPNSFKLLSGSCGQIDDSTKYNIINDNIDVTFNNLTTHYTSLKMNATNITIKASGKGFIIDDDGVKQI